jgi:hypothetical protein
VANVVIARAIASLQKKRAARQAEWNRLCVAEKKTRAERDELDAFVDRYLELRDRLLRQTAEWDAPSKRVYLHTVLREIRLERRRSARTA